MSEVNCPYCNAIVESEGIAEPGYVSACCQRVVAVMLWAEPKLCLAKAGDNYMKEHGLVGDNSAVPGVEDADVRRPASRWSMVCTDGISHFVRICPKFADTDSVGFPYGLSLATTFTSAIEAHRFADNVDLFLECVARQWTPPGD